jgi:hypothetical protein
MGSDSAPLAATAIAVAAPGAIGARYPAPPPRAGSTRGRNAGELPEPDEEPALPPDPFAPSPGAGDGGLAAPKPPTLPPPPAKKGTHL